MSFMNKNRNQPITEGFSGFFSMLIGGALMVILVVSFNNGMLEKEVAVRKDTRITALTRQGKKITPKAAPQKTTSPKREMVKAEAPDMGAIIGDIAMDIPELALANVVGDSRELLDEIASDATMTEATVDSKPKVINRPTMQFPASAAKEGIEGFVVVNLLIAEDGRVEVVKILESQPQGVFDRTVLSGIRNWTFTPATYKGRPVKIWARQKVSFSS